MTRAYISKFGLLLSSFPTSLSLALKTSCLNAQSTRNNGFKNLHLQENLERQLIITSFIKCKNIQCDCHLKYTSGARDLVQRHKRLPLKCAFVSSIPSTKIKIKIKIKKIYFKTCIFYTLRYLNYNVSFNVQYIFGKNKYVIKHSQIFGKIF